MNERIKKLRIEILGITMEEFGDRVGVTRSAISNIESGRRNVSEQIIKAICREFAVREDWIRNGSGEPLLTSEYSEIDSLVRTHGLSELDRIILNKWMALSADQRAVLDDFILDIFADYSSVGDSLKRQKSFEEMSEDEIADAVKSEREKEKEAKEESGRSSSTA